MPRKTGSQNGRAWPKTYRAAILALAGGSFVPGFIARAKIIVSVANMGIRGRAGETNNHAIMEDPPFAGRVFGRLRR